MGAEPLLLLQLDSVPGRVAEHHVEAATPAGGRILRLLATPRQQEDAGEGDVPVQEVVVPLVGQAHDLVVHERGDMVRVVLDRPEDGVGDRIVERLDHPGARVDLLLAFAPHERGAPGVGPQQAVAVVGGAHQLGEGVLFAMDILDPLVRQDLQGAHRRRQIAQPLPWRVGLAQRLVALPLPGVDLLPLRAIGLVVTLDLGKGRIRNAVVQQPRRGTQQAVAALDVAVQEAQRLARLQRLQPQAHLAQLHRHRVEVHAVDAAPDHVAHCRAGGLGRWLLVAGAHGGQPPGDAVGGGQQEVPAPAGRVADLERQDRHLGVLAARRLVKHRVQRGVQQAADQAGGGVVAAGGLALVTAGPR